MPPRTFMRLSPTLGCLRCPTHLRVHESMTCGRVLFPTLCRSHFSAPAAAKTRASKAGREEVRQGEASRSSALQAKEPWLFVLWCCWQSLDRLSDF